jgi:cytochrome c553
MRTLFTLLFFTLAIRVVDARDHIPGRDQAAVCLGCHGIVNYRIAFPQVYRVPKLNGQSAAYIEIALRAYKSGQRQSATMHALATKLSEQDIVDIAAYYAPPRASRPAEKKQAAGLEKGRVLVAQRNCMACHGADFNQPVNLTYPKLAGQYADYLYVAMRAYQTGKNNKHIGRDHAIMAAQMQNLSQRDLRDIAAYLAALPGDL